MPMSPPKHRPAGMATPRETAKAYKHTPKGREANRFYASTRWVKFRRWFLARHPLCDWDGGKCGRPAKIPHHIVERLAAPERAFEEENCRPLCARHHGEIHGKAVA